MRLRVAAGILLLAFAAGSLTWLAVREIRNARAARAIERAAVDLSKGGTTTPAATTSVTVYYLHREQRCDSCETMEAYTWAAVQQGFATELADGRVTFRSEDWEAPQNAELQKVHEIFAPTVLIVDNRGEARKIVYALRLLDDKGGYMRRVQAEISAALKNP